MFGVSLSCRATVHRTEDGGKPTHIPIFFVGIIDRVGKTGLKTVNPAEFFSQALTPDNQGNAP
jgi:hypothetical protein